MSQINQYVYNNIDDFIWEKRVCGCCGFPIVDIKGRLVRMVINNGAPAKVFNASTAYVSILCRKCHTRNNFLVISSERLLENHEV